MAVKQQESVGLAGQSLSMRISGSGKPVPGMPITQCTTTLNFREVEHLLSKKPLKRPKRNRPISRKKK